MRQIKLDASKMFDILQDTLAEIIRGRKKITFDVDKLLTIKPEKDFIKPTIIIPDSTRRQMSALVDVSAKELAWHCPVTYEAETKTYTLGQVLMYPQNVTSVTVNSEDELYDQWLEGLTDEFFNSLRFQGHSHVNMGVSPSGTDTDFYDLLTKHIKDYYIFFILNKQGKYWIELHDIENNLIYETKDINVVFKVEGINYTDWAKEQIDEMVIETKYTKPESYQQLTAGLSPINSYYKGGRY